MIEYKHSLILLACRFTDHRIDSLLPEEQEVNRESSAEKFLVKSLELRNELV
jgi:hypothetical protein